MNISFKNTYIKTYQRTAASEILEALQPNIITPCPNAPMAIRFCTEN